MLQPAYDSPPKCNASKLRSYINITPDYNVQSTQDNNVPSTPDYDDASTRDIILPLKLSYDTDIWKETLSPIFTPPNKLQHYFSTITLSNYRPVSPYIIPAVT